MRPVEILAADDDRRGQARAAGALDVERRRFGRETRRQRRLAGEVEIARVLDDGAERHVAQALAGERVARDERAQHGRHHVLVRAAGVGRVRAAKGNANAADHGDPTSLEIAHAPLRSNVQ